MSGCVHGNPWRHHHHALHLRLHRTAQGPAEPVDHGRQRAHRLPHHAVGGWPCSCKLRAWGRGATGRATGCLPWSRCLPRAFACFCLHACCSRGVSSRTRQCGRRGENYLHVTYDGMHLGQSPYKWVPPHVPLLHVCNAPRAPLACGSCSMAIIQPSLAPACSHRHGVTGGLRVNKCMIFHTRIHTLQARAKAQPRELVCMHLHMHSSAGSRSSPAPWCYTLAYRIRGP
jgi:hypothetical protein